MGQIFNRIKNLSKSYINDADSFTTSRFDINSEDEELKNIIDELSSGKTSNGTRQQEEKYKTSQIDLQSAYKILGINPDAENEEIKSAYKTKIKEYHPDRLDNFGDEIKDLAVRKTKEINEAFRQIRNKRGF